MEWLQEDRGASRNPIDLLEELVRANDWTFERPTETELMVEVEGRWCGYYLIGAVSFSCHFDQKVPTHSWPDIYQLIGRVNEALWLGHFDLTSDEGLVIYRHTVLLRGLRGASVEQLEDLVDAAVGECERFYPALQMVQRGAAGGPGRRGGGRVRALLPGSADGAPGPARRQRGAAGGPGRRGGGRV
jgi:hypothetical protein